MQTHAKTGEAIVILGSTSSSARDAYWIIPISQEEGWLVPSPNLDYASEAVLSSFRRLFNVRGNIENISGLVLEQPAHVRRQENGWSLVNAGQIQIKHLPALSPPSPIPVPAQLPPTQTQTPTPPPPNWAIYIFLGIFGSIVGLGIVAIAVVQIQQRTVQTTAQNGSNEIETVDEIIEEESSTPIPTPTPISSPDTFPEEYYQQINRGNYSTAWQMLTSEHRQDSVKHPNGYGSYAEWWDKVSSVSVNRTTTVSHGSNSATLDTNVTYNMATGRQSSQNLRFYLVVHDDEWQLQSVQRL